MQGESLLLIFPEILFRETVDGAWSVFSSDNIQHQNLFILHKEIEDILFKEYGNTTTIIHDAPDIERLPVQGDKASLPAVLPEISRLADAFERIATALENQTTGTGSQPAVTENQFSQDKEILTDKETAAYLGVASRTLRDWRRQGKGPDYIRIGSKVRYQKSDILNYLEKNKIR